jgi:hypothetical protein
MTAHAVFVRHPLIIKDLSDLVGLVSINACREDIGFFFPQLALDHLPVNGFNLRVASGTRRRDVLAAN